MKEQRSPEPRQAGSAEKKAKGFFERKDVNRVVNFLIFLMISGALIRFAVGQEYRDRRPDEAFVRQEISALQSLGWKITLEQARNLQQEFTAAFPLAEGRALDLAEIVRWDGMLSEHLADMGLEDDFSETPHFQFFPWDEAIQVYGYTSNDPANTIFMASPMPEDEGMSSASLGFLAHEKVHLDSEYWFAARFPLFEQFTAEFPRPLYIPRYGETQAQLLALEAMSRVYFLSLNEQDRADARLGILVILQGIYSQTVRFAEIHEGVAPMEGEKYGNFFVYGYVPFIFLQELRGGSDLSVPVVEHGPLHIGNTLQEISLPYLERFLKEQNLPLE